MQGRIRILSWTVLGIVLLLGVAAGVGWIDVPAILRGQGDGDARDEGRLAEGTPDAEDPTLRGRPDEDAMEPGPGPVPPPVDLDAVDRARDLHGVVVREDDAPVGGANLQVLTHPWRHQDLLMDHGFSDVEEGPLTRSAADGTFRLGLAPGALVALRVSAPGLAPVEKHLLQAGERVRVVLHEPAALRVVVRGPDGEPVEGTSIRLFHRGGRGHEARGTTNAEGVLRLDGLEPRRDGWIDVTPPRLGYPGWVQIHTPDPGEETTVEVDLVEGRTLRGRVTDAVTGEGIPGARVGMNWVLRPEVRTGPDGRYQLPGWTGEGVRDVHVLAEGYARETVEVEDKAVLDFALQPVHDVIGRVLDATGAPVEGARVHAIGAERGGAMGSKLSLDDTRTGPDGRYRLTGLTRGLAHMLVVAAPGFGRTWVRFATHAGEADALDLGDTSLAPGLVLAGVVVDSQDVPVAGAELELRRTEGNTRSTRGVTLDRTTDDLGRFRFPDLSPGGYGLHVRPPEGVAHDEEFRLGDESLVDLRVVIAATTRVTVLVTDDAGTPLAKAHVSFRAGRLPPMQAWTDDDGRAVAELPTEHVGEYTATARCPYRDDLMPGTAGSFRDGVREIEVVLRRAAPTGGRLQTEDGEPVPSVMLWVMRGDQRVSMARTDDDGAFSFSLELGAAPVDLLFDGRTSGPRKGPWHDFTGRLDAVPAGATGVVVVVRRVAADRTLEVRVLDPDGNPVVDAMVLVVNASGRGTWAPRTDDTGTCRIEELREEEQGIRVFHAHTDEEPWAAPPELRVVPAGQRVDVTLRRARRIAGRVTCAGAPTPLGVRVSVERADGTLVSTGGSGRDGSFQVAVPLDEEGPLVLVGKGRLADGTAVTGRMELPSGAADDVTLMLEAP